jgi:hypothetical protein
MRVTRLILAIAWLNLAFLIFEVVLNSVETVF